MTLHVIEIVKKVHTLIFHAQRIASIWMAPQNPGTLNTITPGSETITHFVHIAEHTRPDR